MRTRRFPRLFAALLSAVVIGGPVLAACGGDSATTETDAAAPAAQELDLASVAGYAQGGSQAGSFESWKTDIEGQRVEASGIIMQRPSEANQYTGLINQAVPGQPGLAMIAFNVSPEAAEGISDWSLLEVRGEVTSVNRDSMGVMIHLADVEWREYPGRGDWQQ